MAGFYPENGRVIFHIDANAFFASVEMAENPALKDKPVIIAGNPQERKGIVVAANYLCKHKGVYTTMALREALKLVPEAVVIKPNHALYKLYSKRIFAQIAEISPLIEYASIDEAYLDITACEHLGSPIDIATGIQKKIVDDFSIPLSIGIAPNKFLAKMASDMKKPLGITVLRKRDVERVLWSRPVVEAHGIGAKTAAKLMEHGIATMGDLAKADVKQLQSIMGVRGIRMRERVNGIDDRPVDPEANTSYKSIGNSTTFPENLTEPAIIYAKLRLLARSVSERMKAKGAVSRTIQVMIRYSDFKTVTRSQTLPADIQEEEELLSAAEAIFFKHWTGEPVRLLGITAQNAVHKRTLETQMDLFSFQEEADKLEPLVTTVEALKRKFGEGIIKKGWVQ
ncbi:DNA polymerase IV [Domibacillus sp. DTU_2020_1001157_1_SI_ALB_TIR_016]|uniref:DNA polymerase IV n=1 Tax=Domibacillus sp. DTU_2020_1001157_1_SI_ALB_TIR_016 TaxID=3077789 RepID=UPI0028EE87FC|nr:DNA polymerase IV [Domibacillus sp. DTU_2020_1001157_1_SI_ALB_TIR_016]WNS79442.1 DNA polymerase IV [Domibacillus sp. DTU_2020_1001157_1_SI_ALB_TIR_016]